MTDSEFPYDIELVEAVDGAFMNLPLDTMVGEVVDNKAPQVEVGEVLAAFESFFGGITDVRILDDGVDEDLPLPDGTWDGHTFRLSGEDGDR